MLMSETKRFLIVSCDDFGLCRTVNTAAVRALEQGLATSLSLMAPAPGFGHAVRLALAHGIRRVGVHLTLTSEFSLIRWGGVSPAAEIPTLLDRAGCLHKTCRSFAAHARPDEVLHECARQIEAVMAAGLEPTHLDCHMFSLHQRTTGRSDLMPVIAELCCRYRLPFRSPYEEETCYLARCGIATVSHVPVTTYDLPAARKFSGYFRILKGLEAGIAELILHPAPTTQEIRLLDTRRYDHSGRRLMDDRFVHSAQAREFLVAEGFTLIGWDEAARLHGSGGDRA